MLRNLLLTIGIVLTTNLLVFSQTGTLKGKIIDKETNEPIPFANVVLEVAGAQQGGASSDFDGNYTIKPIDPGTYTLKATFVGYKPMQINGIVIKADKITFYDVNMVSTMETLETFEVVEYEVPLISKDNTSTGATVTSDEIAKMPNKSAAAVATTVGGVYSADGEVGSIRGQRSSGTVTYIDGIKVTGSASVPESAIDQVSVVLGGVPAQYGDATGGIINVTTKGPSRQFGAGLELQSSQFLDAYGYNRVGLNMNGPLIKSKNPDNPTSVLGYFIAGELVYKQDGRPTAKGLYQAKDDVLSQLETNPLRRSPIGNGTYMNSEFIHKDNLEHIDGTQNTSQYSVNVSGKIDVKTSPTINLSVGGGYNYFHGNDFNYAHSMFNSDKNTLRKNQTWRVFGKFTQRFPTDKESTSLIKNVFYTLQADYQNYTWEVGDPDHQDNIFEYGYIGKFDTYKIRSYEMGLDSVSGKTGYIQNGFNDTLYAFSRRESNPILANYADQYYSFFDQTVGFYDKRENVVGNGGLINGMMPESVYGLWASPGAIQTGYGKGTTEQVGVKLHGSADVGNHALQLGLQYEQRMVRSYSVNSPHNLWSVMRGLTNRHIDQLDKSNPLPVYLDGVYQDTVNYNRIYNAADQQVFDKNLRAAMGLEVDGTDWIDIDSYDINTQTVDYYDAEGNRHTASLADNLSVDMFSADEMLNGGNQMVSYYGYDYKGSKLSGKPSFDDFFTDVDENGNYTREMGAWEPIYMAGYIQDQFAFNDLIFNIGVRVDRYDANQKVLADPYLLYPAKTAKEVSEFGAHPGNIGDDYVVYVDNVNSPTTITGYRDENNWYNAEGIEVADPTTALDAGNGISPYLVDANQEITGDAFEDYSPQVNVMPRIAFSFPISDEALFFAHYDILTQRPTYSSRMIPTQYLFWPVRGNPTMNNPNLKPEKTIDYELGFTQKLSAKSSMTLSGFYREVRDQIQSYRYTGAYPRLYYSYNNIDFGTVKGLTVTYDMRRTNNARLRASYTLQFADGTGSDSESASAFIRSGQPNLKTINPLNFDRRHALNLMFDYRYAEGKKYNGPVYYRKVKGTDKKKAVQIFKNTGVNLTLFGGSGTPYTRSSKIYPLGGQAIISGSINGSRLPWQFRTDMRIDRDFNLAFGKKEEGEDSRSAYLNVYLQVLNLFDSENILSVYRATGNPDDDGYLAAAEYQSQIANQLDSEAYRDMYSLMIQSPYNYSSPRQIRVGLVLNF